MIPSGTTIERIVRGLAQPARERDRGDVRFGDVRHGLER